MISAPVRWYLFWIAVCKAIRHISNVHKYARDEDRPEKTLFVITTDGMANDALIAGFG